MVDKSHSLIVEALTRAAAEPAGLPLVGSRSAPGLFAANVAGKHAAWECKAQGLLRVLRSEARGRATVEVCTLSEQGLDLLLRESNPRPVLEALVAALESRRTHWDAILSEAHAAREHLDALRTRVEKVVGQLEARPAGVSVPSNGTHEQPANPDDAICTALQTWRQGNSLADCTLPDLFRSVHATHPAATIGQFHDALRRLHESRTVYLHPWTGPLYQMPEPAYAMLVGHEVAYYVSLSEGAKP